MYKYSLDLNKKSMKKRLAKELKARGLKMAPVDEETVNRIQKISESTGADTAAILNAAVQILEKSLGRQVIVRPEESNWELKINHFKKYQKITDLTKS